MTGYRESVLRAAVEGRVPELAGASVLVTGASGLVGSCLADLLLAVPGHAADVGLAGRDEGRLRARFAGASRPWRFERFDALRPEAPSRAYDFVVHCASPAHPVLYASNPAGVVDASVSGTRAVLGWLKEWGAGRLLYLSSSEVYGTREGAEPYGEGDYSRVDPLDPRSCYPESKRLCEAMCAAWKAEYGVDFVVARPGHVYGPTMTESDSRAHAQFARDAAAGRDVAMKSAGAQLRSYCYCVDCATALAAIMLSGEPGRAYNVSNPDSVVTVRQLAEAFAEAGGVGVAFEEPTDAERRGYNPMTTSALESGRLEGLGWKGAFGVREGTRQTVETLRSSGIAKGRKHE